MAPHAATTSVFHTYASPVPATPSAATLSTTFHDSWTGAVAVNEAVTLTDDPIVTWQALLGELQAAPGRIGLGVTGTHGKSTTTALIGEILRVAGRQPIVAGNIGEPLISAVDFEKPRTYVLELSSFQLESVDTFHANVALLLNITPDHMDRYGSLDDYAAAKYRIFRNQETGQHDACTATGTEVLRHIVYEENFAALGRNRKAVMWLDAAFGGHEWRIGEDDIRHFVPAVLTCECVVLKDVRVAEAMQVHVHQRQADHVQRTLMPRAVNDSYQ